ncbi:hypothetical protein E4T56_gene11044 [Termitomyces sp. T112]|nr:hypothetical protein E4T56_gene11044 [Termitomyces sp. T112]
MFGSPLCSRSISGVSSRLLGPDALRCRSRPRLSTTISLSLAPGRGVCSRSYIMPSMKTPVIASLVPSAPRLPRGGRSVGSFTESTAGIANKTHTFHHITVLVFRASYDIAALNILRIVPNLTIYIHP